MDELISKDTKFTQMMEQMSSSAQMIDKNEKNASFITSHRSYKRQSSVTSLYSIAKERKSVSIKKRDSRSQSVADKSQIVEDNNRSEKSLERLFTFDLCSINPNKDKDKDKDKSGEKKD